MRPHPDPPRSTGLPAVSPVILFDGVCNLCNATVQWIIVRDPEAVFRFAALQSAAARALLQARDAEILTRPETIVLVDGDGVHTRSEAALRIARGLGGPYRLLAAARLVPRPLRDAVYRFVARNRYRWFGRRDVCMTPTPDVEARFLGDGGGERGGTAAGGAAAPAEG